MQNRTVYSEFPIKYSDGFLAFAGYKTFFQVFSLEPPTTEGIQNQRLYKRRLEVKLQQGLF